MIKNKEKKEKIKDFEVAEDGRIIKVNNWESEKIIHCPFYFEAKIKDCHKKTTKQAINLGLVYATDKAEEKAIFKLEIETKLKNIAERLNKKIFYVDSNLFKNNVPKYSLSIEYTSSFEKKLHCYSCGNNTIQDQGTIYCLDANFLDIAKKEIGEDKLIKYFTK